MTMMFNSTSMKSYENIYGGFQLGKWGYPQSSCSHGPWLSIETGPSSKLGISHDFLELSHNYSIIPSIISTRIYIIISTRTLTSLNILVVLSREWMGMGVAGIIINLYYSSFPHSLHQKLSKFIKRVSWYPLVNVYSLRTGKITMGKSTINGSCSIANC